MQAQPWPAQGPRWAAQASTDPAVITEQIIANARSYDAFLIDAAPPSVHCAPLPGQPITGCFGSIAPIVPIPFTLDALGRRTRPVRLHVPSAGINQGFVPSARHEYMFPREPGPANSTNAVQVQARRLLQGASTSGRAQQNTPSKTPRKINKRSEHSPSQGAEAGSNGHPSRIRNGPLLPGSGPPSSVNSPVRLAISPSRPRHTTNASPSNFGARPGQKESSASSKNREYMWLQHGQRDPTVRALHGRSNEDHNRIDAISRIGGACGPCRRSKKRCDAFSYCQGCIHRGIPSEAGFLASLEPASYTPGLENLSLHDLESSAIFSNRWPAEPDLATMSRAQARATNHVNSWFRHVTRSIDPTPFSNDLFEHEVSLRVTSGLTRRRKTRFNLEVFDITCHLERTAYQLDEKSLLAGFVRHGGVRMSPAPRHGQVRPRCVRQMSWVVLNTFAFLRSFADALMYASINSMSAARVTVSMVYASLYRLLLAKSDDLCSFVLKSLQQDFQYCTRRARKDVIEDSLRGLAQYYRVLTGLANLELGSSSEAAALFSQLRDRARDVLRDGDVKRLFLRIYAKIQPGPAQATDGVAHPVFKEFLSLYSAEVPEIKSLSIALRVNSGNNDLAPVSTEAIRETDPYHHYRPIKVRDLLKEIEDVVDPKQVFVDDFLDNFAGLGRTLLEEPGPADRCPSSFLGQEALYDTDYAVMQALSSNLDAQHGSLRPSQQDTETGSIKSELTLQNDNDVDHSQLVDPSFKGKTVDPGWRDVPRGKGCKRRARSGDSQKAQSASDHGNRKHIKLDSGRESPPPYNYFGPLTHEPAALL